MFPGIAASYIGNKMAGGESGSDKALTFLKWLIIAVVVYLIFKLLNKFDLLGDSKETKETNKFTAHSALDQSNFIKWTSELKKKTGLSDEKIKTKYLPNWSKLPNLVTEVYEADQVTDDEPAVYNAFRSLKSQYEVSALAYAFSLGKKKDLAGWIIGFFDGDELEQLNKIINSKPKY